MVAIKFTRTIEKLRKWGSRGAYNLNERTNGLFGILAEAVKKMLEPSSGVTAAAIAYFAVFSLFPLTLLSIAIASFYMGPLNDLHLIVQRLEFIAPALDQLLGNNINEIILARGPITFIAIIGLIWSGSTVFDTVTHTLNQIWSYKRSRRVWKRRGLAILLILSFVGPILFLASLASSTLANISTWLPAQILPIGIGISVVVAILLDIAFFMVIYLVLPHGTSTWRDILPGAIGAGLLWEIAKKIFLLFVSHYISISNLVYGSVTTIIAFLTWAYLSGLIFLLGAYLSFSFYQFRHRKKDALSQTQESE